MWMYHTVYILAVCPVPPNQVIRPISACSTCLRTPLVDFGKSFLFQSAPSSHLQEIESSKSPIAPLELFSSAFQRKVEDDKA